MSAQINASGSHAEAMNRMYRVQRHIYDASRYFYLLGRDSLLDSLKPPPKGVVLEIGCGTGRNLLAAARRYPDAQLYGVDISEEMLKSALRSVGKSNLQSRVKLACADATSFDPAASLGRPKFDRIFFSYSLSMIPDWRAAIWHAASLLAADGELHIADFGQCERLPAAIGLSLHRWLSWFSVTPRRTLRHDMEALARMHGRTITFQSKFGGYVWLAAMTPLPPASRRERVSQPLLEPA